MGYHERGNAYLEERFKGMGGTHTGKTRRVMGQANHYQGNTINQTNH
jgi:hypothetical protein